MKDNMKRKKSEEYPNSIKWALLTDALRVLIIKRLKRKSYTLKKLKFA
jgi:hypothetical protein